MIPYSAVKKPGTDWSKGPDGKWRATVWFWAATTADGKTLQYSSKVTKFTPRWCKFHKWATDHVCCGGFSTP